MAITDKEQGVWELDEAYNKQMAGYWSYTADRQLWAWGRNHLGQLGQNSINTPSNSGLSSPVQVMGSGWTSAWSSGAHIMGTKEDGTAWAIGSNNMGNLGTGAPTPTCVSSPVQMPGTWSSVEGSAGDGGINAAVNTDGELFMWGYNGYGNLGHNNTTNVFSPVQLPGTWATGHNKTGVSGYNSLAIKEDGTLWSWGYNYGGSLGIEIPTGQKRSSPVQVGTGTDWDKIGNLYQASWAIKTDGTLWGFGYGSYGALGQNNTDNYSSPKQVPGTTWKYITSMDDSSCAVKTDGTLWSWGRNANGQLGLNNTTDYSSPKQIPGTNWSTVSSTWASVVATKTDGTLWSWGHGYYGMLGLNTGGPTVRYSSPTQIGTATDWDNSLNIGYMGTQGLALKAI